MLPIRRQTAAGLRHALEGVLCGAGLCGQLQHAGAPRLCCLTVSSRAQTPASSSAHCAAASVHCSATGSTHRVLEACQWVADCDVAAALIQYSHTLVAQQRRHVRVCEVPAHSAVRGGGCVAGIVGNGGMTSAQDLELLGTPAQWCLHAGVSRSRRILKKWLGPAAPCTSTNPENPSRPGSHQ